MIKAKSWNGKDLKGVWEFTLKIDGVRALWKDGRYVSRGDKPLYNIPVLRSVPPEEGYEVYCSKPGRSSKENYKATIQCVRAKTKFRPISPSELYSLAPLDARLQLFRHSDPTADFIRHLLKAAVKQGYEGLVLRQGDKWLKVKPIETYDVKVTGIIEGAGKHKGRMGALMTDMGKVGTGFSDDERAQWWYRHLHDQDPKKYPLPVIEVPVLAATIEVSCMQLTPAGKFRHPRFERIRYDK